MRTIVLILAISSNSWLSAAAAVNWPEFRGPTADGKSNEAGLPLAWSETEHITWKTPVHGKAWSSPVIWDQQIWMTTANPDGKELFAICLDRESGQTVFDVRVFEIEKPQFCHAFNSYASSTPVVEAGRLYVHYGSHGTACLDTATGKVLWSRQDLPCDHFRAAASSPILYGDLLVVAFDGIDLQYVVALDKRTGQTVWKRDRNIEYGTQEGDAKKGYGTATIIEVAGRPQLVLPSAGATIAYEPRTGDEIWRINHGGMNACARALFGRDKLFINTAAGGFKLFAMRVDGQGDVTHSAVEWKSSQGVPTRSSQLLVNDLLFMVSDSGVASCLNADTGVAVRQRRLQGDFSSSPVYADGRIYFCNQDGSSFVLSADRDFDLLATNKLDDGCMASPAIYGKSLFIRTKKHLYRIEQ